MPPPKWRGTVIVLLGALLGLAVFIFYISNAVSYLYDDPKTCINCHVMFPQYATWERSSHAHVATCMDCHVPHDNVINKYFFKIKDGIRHATIFTMGTEPQVIRIHDPGKAVVQNNCIRCHENVVYDTCLKKCTQEQIMKGEGHYCWDCHREVPHGRVNSLSSTPFADMGTTSQTLPQWLLDIGSFKKGEKNND